MGFLVQSRHEKQSRNKHVESTSVTCLDEGSTPSSSTRKGEKVPRNTKKDTDNQKDCRCLFLFLHHHAFRCMVPRVAIRFLSSKYFRNMLTILHIATPLIHQRCVCIRWGWGGGAISKSDTIFLSNDTIFFLHNLLYNLILNRK